MTLSHPLDAIRPLRRFLSVGPFPFGGDGVTINLGFFRRSRPYAHTVGPSLRMIADMAGPGRALFVISPGQSGHFLSPYHSDQLALWRDGCYLRLSDPQFETGDRPSLVLIPGTGTLDSAQAIAYLPWVRAQGEMVIKRQLASLRQVEILAGSHNLKET